MRLLAALILLVACSPPCPLVCQDDGQCPLGYYCLNQSACLPDCVRCGGACVETFQNCGACGVSCAAGQKCSRAACVSACGAGLTDCAGSCYDLMADPAHCGSCNAPACARNETCVQGKCTKVDVCG